MKKNWIKYAGSVIWVVAWVVLSTRFTSPAGVFAAIAGAFCGLFAPEFLARWRVRESVLASAAGLLGLLNSGVVDVLRGSTVFFSMFGTSPAYVILEMLLWGGTAGAITIVLQVLRRRFPSLVALQILFAGATFAAILAAHRDGMQHRPYFLVDALLLGGHDPIVVLLLAGVVTAMSALIWIFCQTSGRRRARDLAVLFVLLLLALLLIPESATKQIVRAAGGGGSSKSGQNQNHDPNPNNNAPKSDPKPVAIVTFHDDYTPPGGSYYFRQSSLSSYRNNRLVADASKQFDTDIAAGFPTADVRVPDGPSPNGFQQVHTTIALLVQHSRPFGLISPAGYGPAANPDAQRFERAYNADSLGATQPITEVVKSGAGTPPGGEAARRYYTTAPPDPRYAQIVEEAVSKLGEEYRNQPVYRAVAVKLWMDEHVTYNLQAKHDAAPDPVADFLFGDRNGYCVHFAQAAALLYRTAGVPARISQGYMVPARQRGHGSALMIRDSDGHAWPEIYVTGAGWIALDITAKKNVSPETPPADLDQQRTLGQMARNQKPSQTNDPSKSGDKQQGSGSGGGVREKALLSLLCALLLAVIVLYAMKLWRRLAIYVCRPVNTSRVAFRAALDRLADAGILRPMAQTREQFSLSLAGTTPSLRPLTDLHVQGAFCGHAQGRPKAEYRSLLQNVGRELRQSRPAWRIAIGYLDPFSWTRVK